ncbi:LuxR family two component transcriptional regulator [Ureibacillus xyleni]|uniref:LuxR family two component transcriptional regulator n=1 Tax=Ureibacillus xyleni TaxID=614648 RepID=A0A285RZ17_9BACL|nr:response regulator transcription factor [Ureibacillus xyleni]SOB99803.1 LuxR family two component transcriptional regulator [Ureibacillus xyleni]
MIKLVIADDHTVVRSGFSMLINHQKDMEVVATASDGTEAYQLVGKYEPQILLMDVNMPPGEGGLIATKKIKEDYPNIKIIILTMYEDQELLYILLKNGASGYILKNAQEEDLFSAIRTVFNGGVYIYPKMATSLVQDFLTKHAEEQQDNPFTILSNRELEILPLIAKGYGNKEIAEKLFISVKTVEAHKAKIMEKLNFKGKPDLVEYALKKRLLTF